MEKLKELLIDNIEKKYNLKRKKVKKTDERKVFETLLNNTLQEEDYQKYLDYTFLDEVLHHSIVLDFKYYNVKLELVEKDVFNYNEKENQVYRADIYRLTLTIMKEPKKLDI